MSVDRQERMSEEAVAARVAATPKPILSSEQPFDVWLRSQVHRKDRVGALARVAVGDPTWPGGRSRNVTREYFVTMGARQFVLDSVKVAWDEYEKQARRDRTKSKRTAQKQARKVQQAQTRRRKRK